MLRKCDGSPASGTTPNGFCSCSGTFDDASREMQYPHNLKPYYNYYGTAASANIILPSGYGGQGSMNWPLNLTGPSSAGTYVLAPSQWVQDPLPPNAETFSRYELERFAKAYVTQVLPGDKIVICMDDDVKDEQIAHLAQLLKEQNIEGIIIRCARAGKGYTPNPPFPERSQDQRLDYMARILDLWEQRPDLTLSELLCWFRGEKITDEDFSAAAEIHFKKVFGGIHGENK